MSKLEPVETVERDELDTDRYEDTETVAKVFHDTERDPNIPNRYALVVGDSAVIVVADEE